MDYITFTVGRECFLESVDNPEFEDNTNQGILTLLCLVFGFGDLEFLQKRGLYGYDVGFLKEGITICLGGCGTIMVQMSGKGCRLYESLEKSLDWEVLICTVQSFRTHNFSRLDIACDTFGVLSMTKLMQYTRKYRYISRFNDHSVKEGNKEEQVLFGSPKSRMLLRIYNKTLERAQALGSMEDVPPDWVRLEFQLRDAAADSFIATWQRTGNISTAYFGIMANQLRYVKKKESNIIRSVTISWWAKFLGNAEKIPMAYKGGLEYNLQSLQKYLFGQAGSSLKTWLTLNDWDTDKLKEIVQDKKLNERQQNLLEVLGVSPSE